MNYFFGSESNFQFDELFFSRTNAQGVIQSANTVFQRVSKFEWNELLFKPHKIIRHPAMPRGVFQLFWDELLSGEQIGCYVVNKAKDGSYYWVFALAFPVEGGFISVRLKPSGPLFETIKKKYSELLEAENSRNLSPAQSKKLLLEELKKLNFKDYKHFMTEALTSEMESRQQALNQPGFKTLAQLQEISMLGRLLQSECQNIFTAYSKAVLVPLNLELQATRIGSEAAPLAAISTQYDKIAKQINEDIKKLLEAVNTLETLSSSSCKFDVCSLLLLQEVVNLFKHETAIVDGVDGVDKNLEMSYLKKASHKNLSTSIKNLGVLEDEFRKFSNIYDEVKKQAAALEIVSISGKVEAVKIAQSNELMSLLNELNVFKASLKECLKKLNTSGNTLIQQVHYIKDDLRAA